MPDKPFLLFDMGNVLLGFSHERMARQMAAVAGVSYERAWQTIFGGDLNERFERGDLSTAEFCDQFTSATGSRGDRCALEEAANDIFHVLPQMMGVAGHLHAAGYRLGILSNTNECHWRYVQKRYAFLTRLFHVRMASFELRSLKPDPAIYARAAERAGVLPADVFYADDRLENVIGAQAAGYDAVLFTSASDLVRELFQRGIVGNY
jgi:HAD superfamily hydrolase (TIGR01509 family)